MVGVVSLLALAVVVGEHRLQGPVLLPVTWEHGVHLGDALVAVAWALCVALVARLVVAPPPAGRLSGLLGEGGAPRVRAP